MLNCVKEHCFLVSDICGRPFRSLDEPLMYFDGKSFTEIYEHFNSVKSNASAINVKNITEGKNYLYTS